MKPLGDPTPGQPRSVYVGFRVLPHEADAIFAAAVFAGLTRAQLLRQLLKHLPAPTPIVVLPTPPQGIPEYISPRITPTIPLIVNQSHTPKLCPRCARIGSPACSTCRQTA